MKASCLYHNPTLLMITAFCSMVLSGCILSDKPSDYATKSTTVQAIRSGIYESGGNQYAKLIWKQNGSMAVETSNTGEARFFPLDQSSYLMFYFSGEKSSLWNNHLLLVSITKEAVLLTEPVIEGKTDAETAARRHDLNLDTRGIPLIKGHVTVNQLQALFNDPQFRASLKPSATWRWSTVCVFPSATPYPILLHSFGADPIGNIRRIAEQCDPDAAEALAERYEQGLGVPQDYREALRWYTIAAFSGNENAQFKLGLFYSDGLPGVKQDGDEAIRWYRAAADQGSLSAMYNVALLYLKGEIVKKNWEEGRKWLKRAADHGHKEAKQLLEKIGY